MQVTKTWTVVHEDGYWCVRWEDQELRHAAEDDAKKSAIRKLTATLRAWKRNGWTVEGPQTQELDGHKVFTFSGTPPPKYRILVTYRIRKEHKAAISQAAKDQGVSETDIVTQALEQYFTT